MRAALSLLALAACGPSPRSSMAPAEPAPAPAPVAPPVAAPAVPGIASVFAEPTAGDFCYGFAKLEADGCAGLSKVHLDHDECMRTFGPASSTPIAANNPIRLIADCVIAYPRCDDVAQCVRMANELRQPRTCGTLPDGAAMKVTMADYTAHDGSQFARFGDVRSSNAAPIERCGIPDETAWITSLACNDGSRPLYVAGNRTESHRRAEQVRLTTDLPGGRCGSIVDDYAIHCDGEPATHVYIDSYVCPN
ncbi:MAG TPA: hypothetical protein VGM88_04990 [Kofleriaceae bacterium]|jgi:hypothetical protein